MPPRAPIRLVIVNDYEVVVKGLNAVLASFRDRIKVVELLAGVPATSDADIALYDTFAAPQGQAIDCDAVLADCRAGRLVVYTWNVEPELVAASMRGGASGYVAKSARAEDLVDALERVHAGHRVVPEQPTVTSDPEPGDGDWPGRAQGLNERESEILAYIVQGISNQELADKAYLSVNTVKSYIRSAYKKMGVTSRSRAVLWGIDHGFRRDHLRIERPQDAV